MKIRQFLFKDMNGCTNHGCVVTGPRTGLGTNGICSCLVNMSRSQLSIIQSRIKVIAEKDININVN